MYYGAQVDLSRLNKFNQFETPNFGWDLSYVDFSRLLHPNVLRAVSPKPVDVQSLCRGVAPQQLWDIAVSFGELSLK